MKRSVRAWWLVPVALVLAGALPARDADKLVRQGDAAFDRGDYAAAVDLYNRAEESITDPGLVAFNKGAALYRLALAADDEPTRRQLFHEAELHYRRCLEDAPDDRRARGLYDLGNALVQQAQEQDVKILQEAVGWYEQCLHQDDTDPELLEDARHNLGLARALLLRARAAKARHDTESSAEEDPNPPPNDGQHDRGPGPHGTDYDPVSPNDHGKPTQVAGPAMRPDKGSQRTNQDASPGAGHERTIPDQDDLVPMSPEDTQKYVDQAAARINRELRDRRQHSLPPPSRTIKDW
ncbi:MAG TPA: hypothetical protein VG013_06445 [Gemmataceae bacterium]|jgi:tetratricopeptide (TPR) repeat protein|nr:hypothetical protein [Gemmataceae bacterium]